MKRIARKVYTTNSELKKDLVHGMGVFFLLNVSFYLLVGISSEILSSNEISTNTEVLFFIRSILPFLLNAAVFVYFLLTKYWVALGMLAAIGSLLLLGLIAGVILSIFCTAIFVI